MEPQVAIRLLELSQLQSALLNRHLAVLLLLGGLLDDRLQLSDLLLQSCHLLFVDLEQLVVVNHFVHAGFVLYVLGSLRETESRKSQVSVLKVRT